MKPSSSLSLDLDNEWSYLRTHGDSGWEAFPSYLDVAVPRILQLLEELGLRITFFVVGQDAALEKNRDALASIAAAGHEIGNHSFRHEPWFHLYSRTEIEEELARAEDHIREVTGQRPFGFRGPGYSLSQATLSVLAERGYRYDATTLPTVIGPLARAYYLLTASLDRSEKQRRSRLFGTVRDGFRPLKPYRWQLEGGTLLEIPVTTLPLLRVPIHFSYLHYLAELSPGLANAYFAMALRLCRLGGVMPSLLLHPLDFLGADEAPTLDFFPAMRLETSVKVQRTRSFLERLMSQFQVMSLGEHADQLAERRDLVIRPPNFVSESAIQLQEGS